MISQVLVAALCDDFGRIYQMSCEKTAEEVIASVLFQDTATKIRLELLDLTDTDLYAHIIHNYSSVMREQ